MNAGGMTTLDFEITQYRSNALSSLEGGTIFIQVQAPSNAVTGQRFENSAGGIASNGSGFVITFDSDTVEIQNADLFLTKMSDIDDPRAGDTLTYILTLANNGLHDALNVEIMDALPAGVTYVAGSSLVTTPGYTIGEPDTMTPGVVHWSMAGGNTISNTTAGRLGFVPGDSEDIMIFYQVVVHTNVAPGTSTITYRNSGTVNAFALSIEDSLPPEVTAGAPLDNFNTVDLGLGVSMVGLFGNPVTGLVSVSRVITGSAVTWFLGSTNAADPHEDRCTRLVGHKIDRHPRR